MKKSDDPRFRRTGELVGGRRGEVRAVVFEREVEGSMRIEVSIGGGPREDLRKAAERAVREIMEREE